MKFLSFLLEHERSSRASKLPLETSSTARLRLTAMFWDPGFEEHSFEVVSEQPDGSDRMLASDARASMNDTGPFEMSFRLQPLQHAGWHRLFLRVDGVQYVATTQVHVLGPRRTPIVRYKGRDLKRPAAAVPAKKRA